MYLVLIGWLYVALMMAAAEATNSSGSVLGAIVTFFMYGLAPIALVFYFMSRSKPPKLKNSADSDGSSGPPQQANASGHAAGAAELGGVSSVRKEP